MLGKVITCTEMCGFWWYMSKQEKTKNKPLKTWTVTLYEVNQREVKAHTRDEAIDIAGIEGCFDRHISDKITARVSI